MWTFFQMRLLLLVLLHQFEVLLERMQALLGPMQALLGPMPLLLVLLVPEQERLPVLRTLGHHLGDRLRRALSVLPLIAVRRFLLYLCPVLDSLLPEQLSMILSSRQKFFLLLPWHQQMLDQMTFYLCLLVQLLVQADTLLRLPD